MIPVLKKRGGIGITLSGVLLEIHSELFYS